MADNRASAILFLSLTLLNRRKAYDTYQFTDYSRYEAERFSETEKRLQHEKQFPKDLQYAFDTGKEVASAVGGI